MKFLVINRQAGVPHQHDQSPETARAFAEVLRRLQATGALEAAYTFVGGGSAYVVTADDTATLLKKVRGNPFYATSLTEVIPILDAPEFYNSEAEWEESKGEVVPVYSHG
jgi:hypothetical protein